jgi:hypothetical protein
MRGFKVLIIFLRHQKKYQAKYKVQWKYHFFKSITHIDFILPDITKEILITNNICLRPISGLEIVNKIWIKLIIKKASP